MYSPAVGLEMSNINSCRSP